MVTRAELTRRMQDQVRQAEENGNGPINALRRLIADPKVPDNLKERARKTLREYGFSE